MNCGLDFEFNGVREMLNVIDPKLIKSFRDKVNSNSHYALFTYKNINGKNLWSAICASMDWITVALDYINNHEFSESGINDMSMQVFTYISAVDIIWESIKQLHRVIIDKDTTPFKGNSEIFFANSLSKDDNEYFKHIRAIFGAHPVDVRDKNDRWFASWPTTGIFPNYDFAVILYNSLSEIEHVVFGFRFSDINEFLGKRYQYLDYLGSRLEDNFKDYCAGKRKFQIEESDDVLRQLNILKTELHNRLQNDYYNYIIDELILLFKADCTLESNRAIVEDYLNRLKEVVIELRSNIQQMTYNDLAGSCIIEPQPPAVLLYPLSKAAECLVEGKWDPVFGHHLTEISNFLMPYVIINETMDSLETYMLIKVGLYNWACRI